MNATIVSRTLSLIPDRVARTQSGSLFNPQAQPTCAHPERITHLATFLDWLGPLKTVTKDDLRLFGLLTPYGKPAMACAIEDEADADLDLDMEGDVELDAEIDLVAHAVPQPVVSAEIAQEPALT